MIQAALHALRNPHFTHLVLNGLIASGCILGAGVFVTYAWYLVEEFFFPTKSSHKHD